MNPKASAFLILIFVFFSSKVDSLEAMASQAVASQAVASQVSLPTDVNFFVSTVKQSANVTTNNPKIKATIINLANAMKDSQRKLFDAYGFIPMMITVGNETDKLIRLSPDMLDYGMGLSLADVKDAMIKNFTYKKYGTYASIAAYNMLIVATLVTAAICCPFYASDLITSSGEIFIAVPRTLSLLSGIPMSLKFLTSSLAAFLTLKYLEPACFMKVSHGVVDIWYKIKAFFKAPFINISDFNQVIDFVSSGKAIDFSVAPNSRKQFVVFVRVADATNIDKGKAFPALKFV